MRRPLLLAAICAVGLVLVLVGQARLKKMVEESKQQESLEQDLPPELRDPNEQPKAEAQPPRDPAAIQKPAGDESVVVPKIDEDIEAAPSETLKVDPNQSPKEQVLSALLETRKVFQNREQVTEDVKKNPHTTSAAITQAAGKLADLAELALVHPQYKEDFNAFYLECVKDDKVITVTRVQCLERYIHAKGLQGAEKESLLGTLPPAVTRLFREIDRGP